LLKAKWAFWAKVKRRLLAKFSYFAGRFLRVGTLGRLFAPSLGLGNGRGQTQSFQFKVKKK